MTSRAGWAWRPGRDALRAWLVSRAAVLALMALAAYLQARHGFGRAPLRAGAGGFFVWDSDWYRRIAAEGYTHPDMLRFFPLVALPGRLVAPFGTFAAGLAVLVVANVSALVYADGIGRLAHLELGEQAGRWAPWLALVNPASFVLVLGYAEATAAALGVWCFLALRRQAWGVAAGLAFLSGLTRPVGLLLALPAFVEALRGLRLTPRREVLARALAVAAAPLGGAAYLLWVWAAHGDPMLPFDVQQAGDLRSALLVWPGEALGRGWLAVRGDGQVVDALHLLGVPLAAGLFVLVARRLPASYTAYAAALLVVALGTPRLASYERYALAAFPLIMVAAALRPRSARIVTWVVCCSGLAGYSVLAFAHRYVP
ncbi:MAG TPA: hypothetical protein VNQ77_01240 [Frankiaceae bacterium]|nr:hypothetical protein [Frankiaceae bacterium]